MSSALHRLRNTLEWCGAAVLVAVSFPIIAFALFFFRAVVLVAFLVGLVGVAILFCAHSPFRCWITTRARGPWHAHS